MNLSQAIAREEGFLAPGSRSNRNNNPGDIEYGTFARNHGATRIETPRGTQQPRFAYFPTPEIGFEAMKQLLLLHYRGQTIAEMMQHYAPPSENDTQRYIENICGWTGFTPETLVDYALGV